MKKRETIAFDLDGVVIDCVSVVVGIVNRELGTRFTVEEVDSWHWVREKVFELTQDREYAEKMEANYFDPLVLRRSKPFPGAVIALATLSEIRDVHFITSREGIAREATIDALREHIPWAINENRLHIRRPGDTIDGGIFKRAETLRVQATRFYEDHGDTARNLSTVTDVHLVDRPYNRKGYEDMNHKRIVGGLAGIMLHELTASLKVT